MKTIITILVLIVVLWGGYALMSKKDSSSAPETNSAGSAETESLPDSSSQAPSTPAVKEFTVVGKSFSFSPSAMKVNLGDRVRIIFRNEGGNHDWVIAQYQSGGQH